MPKKFFGENTKEQIEDSNKKIDPEVVGAAKFLDQQFPGWREKVDPDRLNFRDESNNIFSLLVRGLNLDKEARSKLAKETKFKSGFFPSSGGSLNERTAETVRNGNADFLTSAWRRLLGYKNSETREFWGELWPLRAYVLSSFSKGYGSGETRKTLLEIKDMPDDINFHSDHKVYKQLLLDSGENIETILEKVLKFPVFHSSLGDSV